MDYDKISHVDFDAIVTGELTHWSLQMEAEIDRLITGYFVHIKRKRNTFRRLLLLRDGLTFQNKIEITRGMLPLFRPTVEQQLKKNLKEVENFKSFRNAMAHGQDMSVGNFPRMLRISIITRSGKEKIVVITPESHRRQMNEASRICTELANTVTEALKRPSKR